MDDATAGMSGELNRRQASDAVSGLGWRYMLGALRTLVRVESLAQAIDVSARAVARHSYKVTISPDDQAQVADLARAGR